MSASPEQEPLRDIVQQEAVYVARYVTVANPFSLRLWRFLEGLGGVAVLFGRTVSSVIGSWRETGLNTIVSNTSSVAVSSCVNTSGETLIATPTRP